MCYVLLPEPLNWTPAEMEDHLRAAGFTVAICPEVDHDNSAPPAADSLLWDWCEITRPNAPDYGPWLEVSREEEQPDFKRQDVEEQLSAMHVAEAIKFLLLDWWRHPEEEQWADVLTLAVLAAQPQAVVTDGVRVWDAVEYRAEVSERDYSRSSALRRYLTLECGYAPSDVQDLPLPIPEGCRAFSVRLPQAAAPLGVAMSCESPLSDADHATVLRTMETWLRDTDTAFFGWLADPERKEQRRKIVTPTTTVIDGCSFGYYKLPHPQWAGAFSLAVDDNRKWVHLNPCTFSEFAALFADELAERWILVADYVMDYKQLPRYGETIRQLVRDMHSYGEEDGLVGVWDPDGKPLFSVPRSDVDLGEYLREVCELPAVSLTPWVACVPFRDLLRHRSEIPRTGNFTWLDVSGPPDAPPLPGLGLSPSPEWEVVHAHSDRWLMALGSRFCYMNHDDDWLTVFFRDGSDLRRLVAYALQRAGGYRCPASARTPLPDPVIDHVLAHGAVCPQPAEPSGPQACCLRLLEFRKEWIEPLGKEWTAAELAQAMTIIFDASTRQWTLADPFEAAPGST